MGGEEVNTLPQTSPESTFKYIIKVYVDDFVTIVIARSKEQVEHVATAT
jgi:hypothetical protein